MEEVMKEGRKHPDMFAYIAVYNLALLYCIWQICA
jgi:hypothetical protein